MGESVFQRIFAKLGIAILALALIDLVYINWLILNKQQLKSEEQEPVREISNTSLSSPSPSPSLSPDASPQASPVTQIQTVETKTIVEKESQTIVQTAQKEIFIPMGSGSSKTYDFSDLSGVEVTIDTSKYPNIDYVVFEASIWVEGGNGKGMARLKNIDDSNPYFESEISTTSGTASIKTSSKIPIPRSTTKVYRVQAKTDMTNFPVHVESARIRITLK